MPVAKSPPTSSMTRKNITTKATARPSQNLRPVLLRPRLGDEPALARPRRGEAAWIALAEHLGGRDAVGLRLGEVGLELRRHLLGEDVRHAEPPPLPPALLDVRSHHATSASIVASTESTSPRTSRHARTPSASARRPLGEAR